MHAFISDNTAELGRICQSFKVRRLEIFGSAAEGPFDTERSDIDLLVEFLPDADLGPWMARFFDLKQALEELFGRSVDLVMSSAMRNPWFMREVNRTRRLLYAA